MLTISYNQRTNNIEIRFPYDERIALLLKLKFQQRKFNKENHRAWEIPLYEGQAMEARLKAFIEETGTQADVSDSVWTACQIMENWREENLRLSRADSFEAQSWRVIFGGDLTPLQTASAEYMHRNAHGVILGDAPSYNPGVTMLGVLEASLDYPCLVLTRETDKLSWQTGFRKYTRRRAWVLGDELATIHAIADGETAEMAVVNFGSMEKWLPWIIQIDWKSIVIDQAHYIKNGDSDQAHILKDLTRDTRRHRYMLSQSDFLTHPWEAAAQLEVLGRLEEDFGGRTKFMLAYTQHRAGMLVPRHTEELDEVLRSVCYVAHKKEGNNG